MPGGNQAVSEVAIQQQQITIDELLAHIVKLEEHVMAFKGGLASAGRATSVLLEQLTAKQMNWKCIQEDLALSLPGYVKKKTKIQTN